MFLLFACFSESSHRSYIEQLHHVQQNPEEWASCRAISEKTLMIDCMFSTIPKLSENQSEKLCSKVQFQKDECYFLIAEQSLSPKHCSLSGKYQLDCQMHILTKLLDKRKDYKALLEEIGRPTDDKFGWTAIYRHELLYKESLEPSWCKKQEFSKPCLDALYGTYQDRLHRHFRCHKLHKKLHYEHDEKLSEMYNRQRSNKCP